MNERVEKWLFQSFWIDPKALALIRMLFAGYFLLFLGGRLDWLATYPDSFFHPTPGLAAWLPGFPPLILAWTLAIFSFVCTTALFFGFRTPWASRGMALGLFVFFVLVQGFGKNDHTMLIALCPLLMSFSGWGQCWSMDAGRRQAPPKAEAWPIAILALVIGFLWMTAGLFKALGGWLEFDSFAVQANVLAYGIASGHESFLNPQLFESLPDGLLEALDWGVVFFEILFFPAAFFPRLFRLWIFAAITLHLGIFLYMGFDFSTFVLCYMPLFAWNGVNWKASGGKSPLGKIRIGLFLGILLLLLTLYLPYGAPYQAMKHLLHLKSGFWLGFLSLLTFWLGCGVLGVLGLRRKA